MLGLALYRAIDNSDTMTLIDFRKAFNIRNTLEFIKEAWDDLNMSMINACWNALWPEQVYNFRGFPSVHGEVWAIVQLSQQTEGEGLSDMTEQEVHNLLDSHYEEPTNMELLEMVEDPHTSNNDDDNTAE